MSELSRLDEGTRQLGSKLQGFESRDFLLTGPIDKAIEDEALLVLINLTDNHVVALGLLCNGLRCRCKLSVEAVLLKTDHERLNIAIVCLSRTVLAQNSP